MKPLAWAMLVLTATAAAQTRPSDPPAATAPAGASAADVAAADMLHRHAQDLLVTGEAPSRAARRRAALEMAHRLAPRHPHVARDLAGIYLQTAQPRRQADALRTWLMHHPQDYAVGLDWLRARRGLLQTAEQRIAFFEQVAGASKDTQVRLGRGLRAAAWAQIAGIRAGQGRWTAALDAAEAALELDPHNPEALDLRLRVGSGEDRPTPPRRLEAMLAKLAGRPSNVDGAIVVGNLLGSLGLHDHAARFYRHAHDVLQRTGSSRSGALSALCDALLDAGRPRQVVELLAEGLTGLDDIRPLQFKLIEAYRRLGQVAEVDEILAELAPEYRRREPAAVVTPGQALEVAWFYLVVHRRPELALAFAREAHRRRFDDGRPARRGGPAALLGAAEIAAGKTAQGVERLADLSDEDPFAAAFLAEHSFAEGDADAGRRAVRDGLALSRSGWAYRRLRDLARKHDIKIPPPDGRDEAARAVEAFDMRRLAPAVRSADFITITLRPVAARPAPCEPVQVEAVLTNTGDVPVTLGPDALLAARMALKTQAGKTTVGFADPPDAVWAAPRRLDPGETIRTTVDLGAGPVGRTLSARPLVDVEVTVSALPGPVFGADELRSTVSALTVKPVTLRRVSLLERVAGEKRADPAGAYREALGWIVYDLKGGKLPARMRAARQVASLVGVARRMELGQAGPPAPLADAVDKPVLLRMVREVMTDDAPVVRAQLLIALQDVSLDASILKRIAPAASDDAPLVRMCMAELIGVSDTPGSRTLVDYLAGDDDPLVAAMASALGGREP
ncbi:MAG: hypothetical protein ACOC8F_06225 [Planctomycetota bacterium]